MVLFSTLKRFGSTVFRTSNRYYGIFKKNKNRLIITNCGAGVSMFIAGDVFEQLVIEKKQRLDCVRTLAMGGWGLLYAGIAHTWYRFMSKSVFFGGRLHLQALLFTCTLSPMETLFFYYFVGCLEGESNEKIKSEISRKFLVTYLTDTAAYYPFMLMNLKFVPLHLRTTVDLSYGLGYSIFLSYVKHHNIKIPMLTLFEDESKSVADDESIIHRENVVGV